jgi:hypothetical protein
VTRLAGFDQLHDHWFDLNAVVFDSARMHLTIPYWSDDGWRYPRDRSTGLPNPFDRRVEVLHVLDYVVADSERIGVYSFRDVTFADGTITIRADPRLIIQIRVEKLEIRLA